jgi:hypothetical protein
LCLNCNGGLVQFRDDPTFLPAAAYYVSFHTARQAIAAELASAADPQDGPAARASRR